MFFVVLLLMYSSPVIANGSDCCHKVMGSCRSACEQLYMDAIADLETKQQRLLDVKNFCSSSLNQFWKCVNETQSKVGDSNVWKSCCNHAVTDQCHQGCESSESTNELTTHCRQSDEMYLFDCVEIKQEREECCGLARKPDCHGMCRRWVVSPSLVSKTLLANTCSSPVINCLATLVPRVPLRQPHKYLHCCEHSNIQTCRDACRSALKKQSGVDLDRLQENLDSAGCQPVSFHDKMWQCFLRSNQDPPIGNYEDPKLPHAVVMLPSSGSGPQRSGKSSPRAGINDAKLHCCKKALTSHCKKSCFKIFSSEFDWGNFEEKCGGPTEESMNQCFDEVTEPCVPGCKNMNFCTMFNNQPLDLFRSCSVDSDMAAKADYETWVKEKKIELPEMEPLFLKNIEECSATTWKAVACAMQLKPCDRISQSTRICRSSCRNLLRECLDDSKHRSRVKEARINEVCSKLASTSTDDTNCVMLERFLSPDTENRTEEYTTPCVPDECGAGKFCEVRHHHCPKDKQGCAQHVCQTGCPVGQVSAYVVPKDAFVPIPAATNSLKSNCFKICQCKSRITDCESLFCINQEHCRLHEIDVMDFTPPSNMMLVTDSYYTSYSPALTRPSRPDFTTPTGPALMPGSTLYIKCNLCVCNSGEIICSKRNCNETSPDIAEPSFFQLPCTCPPKYEPVCTVTGLTLQNKCLADCVGFQYTEGECTKLDSCLDGPGKEVCGAACISDPKVCLLHTEKDCPQHQCVPSSGCQHLPDDPVCDEEGTTHKNPCYMVAAGKKMAYRGQCLHDCKDSTVCGVDGNMYPSECHATTRYISVDYEGPCTGVGIVNNETGEIEGCAKDVQCPPLPAVTSCAAFIPPGACCPVCAGAIRVLYSQKQITRSSHALNTRSSSKEFTVEKIMKSLNRHIDVAECAAYGHLTMEMDLLVLVKSTLKEPTEQQLQVCVLEAEKLAVLIQRGSPRIATELSSSILVYAKVVHFEYNIPGSSSALRTTPFALVAAYLIILAQ